MTTLIIGAGFSGLGAAIRLQQAGLPFLIVEAADQVGGTWQANTYPGCACDIPAVLYSLSFAPNAAWTRRYPRQPEILAYLERVVAEHGLASHIKLGVRVERLRWQEAERCWAAQLSNGQSQAFAQVICAVGALVRPRQLELPGAADFRGAQLHTARWDPGLSLAGKRVALVGTGASAIQVLPELAREAALVTVFQRTPSWVVPRMDAAVRPARTALGLRLARWAWYWANEARVGAFLGNRLMLRAARALGTWHLKRQVQDPALRAQLTPDYSPGCKRVLVSDDYYPSFKRENVRLVPQAARGLTAGGVVSADGQEHAADVVVYATGFVLEPLVAPELQVVGRAGVQLHQAWARNAATHLGLAAHGFPNLYFLLGPNTALGHNSVVFMSEASMNYVMGAIRFSTQTGCALELKRAVQDASYAQVQARLKTTVWASGCQSWYQRQSGAIDVLWPGSSVSYWWRTRRFELKSFEKL